MPAQRHGMTPNSGVLTITRMLMPLLKDDPAATLPMEEIKKKTGMTESGIRGAVLIKWTGQLHWVRGKGLGLTDPTMDGRRIFFDSARLLFDEVNPRRGGHKER